MASSPQPDFIQEALPVALLFPLPPGVPCPQGQETWPIHFVDFLHGLFLSAAHGTGFLFLLAYFSPFGCRKFRGNGRIRMMVKSGFAAIEEFEEDGVLSKYLDFDCWRIPVCQDNLDRKQCRKRVSYLSPWKGGIFSRTDNQCRTEVRPHID